MKQFTIPTLAISTALIFLTGCASYQAMALNNLSSEGIASNSSDKNDVVVIAKTFNKDDCKRYLDRDVIRKGYQPVQLCIQNNTEKNYVFSLNRVSLSSARPEEVANKVHTSTVGRAVGYGVGSVFLWPLAIPAIVDGIKSSEANQALDTDYYSKSARDHVILPHSQLNKILFVPSSDYQSKFSITLVEEGTLKTKTIEVNSR